MKPAYWQVPEIWRGETAAILGGGPSLKCSEVESLRSRCKVVAVNDALRLAPWADAHYFCDDKWWGWHREKPWYRVFRGIRVTLENPGVVKVDPSIKSLRNDDKAGLSEDRSALKTGQNSGYQALGLAVHLGATKILLLGFDMHAPLDEHGRPKTHWFGDHPGGTSVDVYAVMVPHFRTLIEPLKRRGVEVVNCTPGSAIKCFRFSSVEDELADRLLSDPLAAALST